MNSIFLKKDIKAVKESFGWVLALPNGQIDFYSFDVNKILVDKEKNTVGIHELRPYLIDVLQLNLNNFYLEHPIIVTLEVTRKCSLSCPHCYINAGKPRSRELTLNEIIALLGELAQEKVFCIQITGGEPLEHPKIIDIINYANNLGFTSTLSTNGLNLNKDIIKNFPKANFSVAVSLDGISTNQKIRGTKAKFETIKEKILLLKRANIIFDVMLTINKLNINDAPNLIKWCFENDIMLETLDTFPLGRCKQNSNLLLSEDDIYKDLEVFRLKEELEDHFEEMHGPRNILTYPGFLQFCYWLNQITRRCKGGRSIAYIASNGDIFPCSNCASEQIFYCGNIRDQSFRQIWNCSFNDIRSITWDSFNDCLNCELSTPNYYCCGRCPALSFSKTNSNIVSCGISETTQKRIKMRTKEYIKMHANLMHSQINPARVYKTNSKRE